MKREFLEGLGLEKDVIDKVMAENGKDIEATKANTSTLETELATTKKLLEDANKEIEGFKDLDIEEITKRADKYKEDYEALEIKSKEEIDTLQFNHELEGMARDFKARNVKAVLALLDKDELRNSKNRKEDIHRAFETVAEENDFLFIKEESANDNKAPNFVRPNSNGAKIEVNKANIEAIEDPIERKRMIAQNIELFN